MAISAQSVCAGVFTSVCAGLIMVFSVEEYVFLGEYVFGEHGEYSQAVKVEFSLKFHDTPIPNCSTVCKLIQKFRQNMSVDDTNRNWRPSKHTD